MAEATVMPSAEHRPKGNRRFWSSGREGNDPPDQRPPQRHRHRAVRGWWGRQFGRGKGNEESTDSDGSQRLPPQGGVGQAAGIDVENAGADLLSSGGGKVSSDAGVWAARTDKTRLGFSMRPKSSASGESRIFPR